MCLIVVQAVADSLGTKHAMYSKALCSFADTERLAGNVPEAIILLLKASEDVDSMVSHAAGELPIFG